MEIATVPEFKLLIESQGVTVSDWYGSSDWTTLPPNCFHYNHPNGQSSQNKVFFNTNGNNDVTKLCNTPNNLFDNRCICRNYPINQKPFEACTCTPETPPPSAPPPAPLHHRGRVQGALGRQLL